MAYEQISRPMQMLYNYSRLLESQQYLRTHYFPAMWAGSALGHGIANLLERETQILGWDIAFRDLDLYRSAGWDAADKIVKAGPMGDISTLLTEIKTQYVVLNNLTKLGYRAMLGSGLANWAENLMVTGQLVYAYKTMMYHTAILPRMRRYYNYLYHPNYPNMELMYNAYLRAKKTKDEVIESGRMDGWSKEDAELLFTLAGRLPTAHEAFYLHKKGSVTLDKRNELYKAEGWSEDWWDILTANWEYTPTLYDLTRIADYVELDQVWATGVMRRRAITDADIAKIWPMLKVRPLRDEVRLLTTHGIYMREHGYWDHNVLHNFLLGLKADGFVQTAEVSLLEDLGDERFERELLEERINILRWDFRMARITEKEFLDGLLALGVIREKANLIVETEIAMGYLGYY